MLKAIIIPAWITLAILYIVFFIACRKLAKEDEKRAQEEAAASIEYLKHCGDQCEFCNIRINCVKYRKRIGDGRHDRKA